MSGIPLPPHLLLKGGAGTKGSSANTSGFPPPGNKRPFSGSPLSMENKRPRPSPVPPPIIRRTGPPPGPPPMPPSASQSLLQPASLMSIKPDPPASLMSQKPSPPVPPTGQSQSSGPPRLVKESDVLSFLKTFTRPVSTKEIISNCGGEKLKDALMATVYSLSDNGTIKRAPGRIQAWRLCENTKVGDQAGSNPYHRISNVDGPLPSFEELKKQEKNKNDFAKNVTNNNLSGGPPKPPHMMLGKTGPPQAPSLLRSPSLNTTPPESKSGPPQPPRPPQPPHVVDAVTKPNNANSSPLNNSFSTPKSIMKPAQGSKPGGPPPPPHMITGKGNTAAASSPSPRSTPSRATTGNTSGMSSLLNPGYLSGEKSQSVSPAAPQRLGGPPMPPHLQKGSNVSPAKYSSPPSTVASNQNNSGPLGLKKPGAPPPPPHVITGKGGPPPPPHILAGKGGPPPRPNMTGRGGPSSTPPGLGRGRAPTNTPPQRPKASPQATMLKPSPQATMLSADAFSALNKNAVSSLNELAQKQGKDVKFELINELKGGKNKFTVACRIGGYLYEACSGPNMKEARRDACEAALKAIMGQNINKFGGGGGGGDVISNIKNAPKTGLPHFDNIAFLSNHAFCQLSTMVKTTFAGKKVIAGLVMKENDADSGRVISIGSGNRCITGERLSLEGKVVNDSHAEIVCRRGFIRFLYSELEKLIDGDESSILMREPGNNKPRVKDGFSFHLYISTAPCGDGALFTPRENQGVSSLPTAHSPEFSSKVQGVLRTKIEDGEGTIPIPHDEREQTMDGIMRGQRLRTMSCSDKVCRWNVLGLQGGLLSNLIQPVYLGSLTLGYLFDHGHLSRALCCRMEKGDKLELPAPFAVHHPWLGRITKYDVSRETEKTNNISINWCAYDDGPEVTDGRIGAQLERSNYAPAISRLCKREMFRRFRKVCEKLGDCEHLLELETYREVKDAAVEFQTAKKTMKERFQKGKFGNWLSKPAEQDMSIGVPE